ncbi:phenylacetic acid degradation b [Rufibacter roseus]|uniref:Phenylacetic acid degradation b n=1 Tax=Rufibacter roseus TaxID=1567108 RepID=A0ABW2DLJ0_9BACT|nr:phenylacetic acid degradation b [Rufibacter roseus]
MSIESLDPRVTRLQIEPEPNPLPKPALDQLITFEVFHQKKEGLPFTYVGPVHAADEEIAFLFAKEQYSRRAMCSGMWIASTEHVFVSGYADDSTSVYDTMPSVYVTPEGPEQSYEIFHLKKRGKAHQHVCTVTARSSEHALEVARQTLNPAPPVVSVWIIPSIHVLRQEEDRDMWATTPEKKYREAIAYRVQDKIDRFKAEQKA